MDHLRYKHLNAFDAALNAFEEKYTIMASPHQACFPERNRVQGGTLGARCAALRCLASSPADLDAWEACPCHPHLARLILSPPPSFLLPFFPPPPPCQYVSRKDNTDKVIVYEKGDCVFVFNFNPTRSFTDYRVGCLKPGK